MRRNIAILSWINFFIDFAFYKPILVLYFAAVTGSFALGMSIFSITWISSALFEVPTGVFSDMIGRKKTVVLGAVSVLLSTVLYAIGGNYWWLAAGALLEGLGKSFYSGNNDALLYDTLTQAGFQEKYHWYFSRFNMYNEIGLAIVVVAGSFAASISYSLAMWISVFPRMTLVMISFFLIEPSIHTQKSTNIYEHLTESLRQFRMNEKLRLLTIVSAMRTAVYEGAYQFRTAFVATLWPTWALGFSNMISNIGAAVSFYYSGKAIDRFGYKRVLVFEIIINRIINLSALIFPTVVSPALMATTSLSYGVTTTAVNTMLQKEFSSKERATLGSLSNLFGSVGYGVLVILLGYIGDRTSPAAAMIAAHIFILSILFFYKKIFTSSTK